MGMPTYKRASIACRVTRRCYRESSHGLDCRPSYWPCRLSSPDTGTCSGSRDVWQIIGQGHENDRDYLPRVMAAVLIMQNPSVLD